MRMEKFTLIGFQRLDWSEKLIKTEATGDAPNLFGCGEVGALNVWR